MKVETLSWNFGDVMWKPLIEIKPVLCFSALWILKTSLWGQVEEVMEHGHEAVVVVQEQ